MQAKLPTILRYAALALLILTVVIIVIAFYRGSLQPEFRMKGLDRTKLSKDQIGEVYGYERRESENNVPKYFIKAESAITFADQHQEFEKVYLQLYNDGNLKDFDEISSNKAIYIPAGDGTKNFKIYFAGNVKINTRSKLQVETDQLSYDQSTGIAEGEEEIKFLREGISGKSFGAIVDVRNKTLKLLRDVDVFAVPGDTTNEFNSEDLSSAHFTANSAFVDQTRQELLLDGNVKIALTPKAGAKGLKQDTDIESQKVKVYFENRELRRLDLDGNILVYQKPGNGNNGWMKTRGNHAVAFVEQEVQKVEIAGAVQIESAANGQVPTKLNANRAVYTKAGNVYELFGNVRIETVRDSKNTLITASEGVYKENQGTAELSGGVTVTQGSDVVKGDSINTSLYAEKTVRRATVIGNAYLKQDAADRATVIKASSMNAFFDQNGNVRTANTVGNSSAEVIPKDVKEYTRFNISSVNALRVTFRPNGTLNVFETDGRTSLNLNVPNNSQDAANKTVTADRIETTLAANGTDLANASAIGNAELVVTPLRNGENSFVSVVNAERFDCDFFEKNNAKSCVTKGTSKVVRKPTVSGKELQTLTAKQLVTSFNKGTQDINTFDAIGNATFVEGDRNGVAERINYTGADGVLRLRGGMPNVWDSSARAKADQIDWHTRQYESYLNGNVAVTYYSQKKTNGAAPFTDVNSPIFITSNQAKFEHRKQHAVFTGNARAWQEDNYVRGNRLYIEIPEGKFVATGDVSSLLYDVNQTVGGRRAKNPVYVSASEMQYQKDQNVLSYSGNVDIRQGTDRITAGSADVYLDSSNNVSRTIAENNVVITQPGRKATGDFAEYVAADETVVLRGNPARVNDSERGSAQGREVKVYVRENRVEGEGKSESGAGRMRTVYKIKNGKLN